METGMSLPEVVLASRGMSFSCGGEGWSIDACSIERMRHRSVSETTTNAWYGETTFLCPGVYIGRRRSVGRSRISIVTILIRGKSGLRGKSCQVTPGHCSKMQ